MEGHYPKERVLSLLLLSKGESSLLFRFIVLCKEFRFAVQYRG
jgi:hypothetical protein